MNSGFIQRAIPHDAKTARALSDEDGPAVGQQRHAPRMRQPSGQRHDPKPALIFGHDDERLFRRIGGRRRGGRRRIRSILLRKR
jgi:hypothetical protein